MTASDSHRAIHAVWRIESARIIAALTRMTGDVGLAEELAQDALVIALDGEERDHRSTEAEEAPGAEARGARSRDGDGGHAG